MKTLVDAMFGLHALVAAMFCISFINQIVIIATGAPTKPGETLSGLALMALLVGTAYWVWTLRASGRYTAALVVLGGMVVLTVGVVIYAASTARWN